jgi:hypothetical protein
MKENGPQMHLTAKESKSGKECLNMMASLSMGRNLAREHIQSTASSHIMDNSETISFQEKEK